MTDFEDLLREADQLPIQGWSFDTIRGRWQTSKPPWDFGGMVRDAIAPGTRLLDLGTGGGEFLSSLSPLPKQTWATEGYLPNLPAARARLEPLGVQVIPISDDHRITLPGGSIDVVMDRHEAFDAREVARVLTLGGKFITQQVGKMNYHELMDRFGVNPEPSRNHCESSEELAAEIAEAGLSALLQREARWEERFLDVGAVVYFLRMAPWEVPGFSVDRFRKTLTSIHKEIRDKGYWGLTAHRLLVLASK